MNKKDFAVQSDRQTVTCVVQCESADALRHAKELTGQYTCLDETISRTLRYYPNGVEKKIVNRFRLGDYFDKIELVDEAPGTLSFSVIFHPAQGVESYWKDLMMGVLRSIVENSIGVSIESLTLSP